MHRIPALLFSPAIRLMNRLPFYKKFALLGLIALVTISVTLSSLYISLNKVVSDSERERHGLSLMRPLIETIQRVQRHRGLSAGVLGGAAELQTLRQAKQHEIEASFNSMENLLPADIRQYGFWKNIVTLWKDLQTNGLSWERRDNFSVHTRLIEEMIMFVGIIADDYGLTADPDIDAFYLAFIADNDLLKALEQLGQIRAYGTGVLAAKKVSDQQKDDIHELITLLNYTLKQLSVNMQKAARYNPAIRQALSATYRNIETSSQQVVDKAQSDILSERFSIPSGDFFAATTLAIDQGYEQLYQALFPSTLKLLDIRIQQAKQVIYTTVGFALLLAMLAAYFMAALYIAMLQGIESLSQTAVGFVQGDMHGRVHLASHDELSQIGNSFNEMADELSAVMKARQNALDLLQNIANRVPGMVYQFRRYPDGRACLPYASEAISKIFRVSHEEVREDAAKIFSTIHPDDLDGVIASIQTSAQDLTPWRHEFRVSFADDTVNWLSGNAMPQRETDGSTLWHGFVTDISERKLVEEKLRLLSTAIEQHPASVVITNLDAEIEYVNAHFTGVTGYTLDEAIGQNPRILQSGLTDASIHQSLWDTLTSNQRWIGEFINKRKDGTFYREEAYISPVTDTSGKVTHYVAVKLDITQRHQTEQRERIHNQVLEQLTRGDSLEKILTSIELSFRQESPDTFCCIMLLDDTGKRLHIGAAPPDLPKFFIEAIDGIAVGDDESPCGRAAFRGERVIVENIPQDPSYAALNDLAERAGIQSCWSQPIKNSKGEVLGTFAICHQKPIQPTESESALIELYANLAQLAIESSRAHDDLRIAAIAFESKEGMMVTDSHNIILRVNKAFTAITGYSAEEAIGKTPKMLNSGRQNPDFYAAMWKSINCSGSWEGEIWNRTKNGAVYPEWLSITVVKNEAGDVTHYVASMNDITEHKKVEAAALHAKEQAEALAQYKSEFLANMSHEIRTPMNAIIGLSQLALNKQVPDDVSDYLKKINSSSESLLGILNDILDFSKIEVGKLNIENTRFDLSTILDNLHNLFAAHAQGKFLEFSIEMAQDVPTQLLGDALRIQQVLSNLLGNAIKFTASGEVRMQVKLLERENSQARIHFSVKDSGIGISPKDQAKLFQPFSQADTSITRRFGGTGLGLAISHQLLQLMGSDLHVESTQGQGATFSFDLLLGIATQGLHPENNHRNVERKPGTLTSELRKRGHQKLSGCRILVAEDNSINQQVVKEFLQLCEMQVTIANNGVEALRLLENNRYDAVLMDVHMPEMGGVEATQRIRQQAELVTLPVIALTAGVTQEERDNCLASGMDDFVKKPISPELLIETLVHWIKPGATDNSVLPVFASHESQPMDLPGFDFSNLLKMLGNNRERVDQLLLDFRENMKTVADQIESLIAAENYTSARELAHTLKGASANIGAVNLCSASAALENELKTARTDTRTVSAFQAAFDQTMTSIADLSLAVTALPTGDGNPEALKHAAADLDQLLQEGDFVSESVLDGLKTHLPADKQDAFKQLRKHIVAIQYGEARMLLRQLVEFEQES